MNKYYGQIFNGTPVDRFLYERYFMDKKNGFFIEAGAADGLNLSSCRFFEEVLDWSGINVEASPDKYSELIKNRPDSYLNINKGLLHEAGTFIFRDDQVTDPTRFPGWGNGSFQHTEKHFIELCKMGLILKESEIETITYRQLIKEYDIKKVDLFVLDVEGMEHTVIEGMKGCSVLPKVMFIETEHIGIEPTTKLLEPMGYKLDWNDHCNSAYILK